MSRAVLFIGGSGPKPDVLNKLLKKDDLVCAADSGLDMALAAGIRPDGIVGDMDSLSDTSLLDSFSADIVEIHPVDKDETDTELGIAWLRARGGSPLIIIGGGEGRLDHTLALKALCGRNNPPDAWFTAREMILGLEGYSEILGIPGSPVSFVAAGSGPWRVESEGLQWELGSVDWDVDSISLSNRFISKSIKVSVHEGRLLMIRPIEDYIAGI